MAGKQFKQSKATGRRMKSPPSPLSHIIEGTGRPDDRIKHENKDAPPLSPSFDTPGGERGGWEHEATARTGNRANGNEKPPAEPTHFDELRD